MELKRHYNRILDELGGVQLDEHGKILIERDAAGQPVLSHIEVRHTGTGTAQNFSTGLVAAGITEGWISIGKGVLTLHGKPEDLRYRIKRVPGEYWPNGKKEVIHAYECELEPAQHRKFRARKGTV